jgi:Holliday junction resolvase
MIFYDFFVFIARVPHKTSGDNLFAHPETWIVITSFVALGFAYYRGRRSRDQEITELENRRNREVEGYKREIEKIKAWHDKNVQAIKERSKAAAIEMERKWRESKALILGDTMKFRTVDERIERLMEAQDEAVRKAVANRAPRAADELRAAKAEKRELWRTYMLLKTRMEVYESLAPWLEEYMECSLEELLNAKKEAEECAKKDKTEDDPGRRYLTDIEYANLSDIDRNQLALDRYWKSHVQKNLWLVGIQYERYIGWQYEKNGYDVIYHGALKGKEDLGIDLVATKNGITHIVQCKRYSEIKRIPVRENSVAQIFGAAKVFEYQEKLKNVIPVIITSFELSEEARRFAKALKVMVREHEPLKMYPCIKCNINKAQGERIYHLPFDQMYDRTKVEPETGEFYAATIQEAHSAGFRRAFRWRGER